MAAVDQLGALCKGMLLAEFTPSSKVLAENSEGSPAEIYCNQLPNSFEQELCRSLKQNLEDRLTEEGSLTRRTVLRNHRLSYLVASVVQTNPNFMMFGYSRSLQELTPWLVPDMPDKEYTEDAQIRPSQSSSEASGATNGFKRRKMGQPFDLETELDPFGRGSWRMSAVAQGVCDKIVPTKIMFSRFYRETPDLKNPYNVNERLRSKWRQDRKAYERFINENMDEGEASLSEEEKASRSGKDNMLKDNLYCDDLTSKTAIIAEEQMNAESRLESQKCFICVSQLAGDTETETCRPFKKSKANADADAGADAPAPGASGSGGAGAGGAGSGDKKTGLRFSSLRNEVAGGAITDEWGFTDDQKVTCEGSIVDPKKAKERLLAAMMEAMKAPNMQTAHCSKLIQVLRMRAVEKRNVLAQIIGEPEEFLAKCEAKEKGPKSHDACHEALMEFKQFHEKVIDDTGRIKSLYAKESKLREYGNIDVSVCADLGYCEDSEHMVLTWLKADSGSRRDNPDSKQRTFPPGFQDPIDLKSRMKHFRWPIKSGNPAHLAGQRMMGKTK